ncbi:phosphotransferase [Agromyces ramosus]|uniref:Aminoglycoside phosphotransferase (APT) family kinase protein n=1 Tax=Agromyces ramosus TaxID=33879 RepID=A0ABU0R6L0_9MICO|nr:phosphotransferase [Agromyces ramosus]MDQ0892811.1 aminoglycoside phosphotransferase (APT) family kinase protein [Agromyces ramosus]
MARPPLTLAALATAAVPGLEVQAARLHTRRSHGAYDAVLLRTAEARHLLIRAPRSQASESEQSADLIALRALTPGIRSRLPFEVPVFVGQAPIDGTRAVVTEFVPGSVRSADELTEPERLAESVGLAIAAIHALPSGFIAEAGLPKQTAEEARDAVVALIGRAADTGRLPAALLRRWEEATDDSALWRFKPTVVNGSLTADSILVDGERVTGVIGWSALSQSDPARDLHWLLTSRGASAERALEAYVTAREGGADAHLPQRALLYGELELARWLLHGVEARDDAIMADAVALLDGLVSSVHDRSSEPLSPETGPILTVDDVERLLDGTPRRHVPREAGGSMLTDTYDFSDLERHAAGERDSTPQDATAPIPLDLSDWGDATPPSSDAQTGADAGDTDDATDAQARRNAASS